MERYKHKKVLIVGLGRTGFALINFFNTLECSIRVTDLKPIFDLNKAVKRLKKIVPTPEVTFGEHKESDFLEADVIVYSSSVDPNLPQLDVARAHGKEVISEFALAYKLCKKPVIAVCGSYGRTITAHMIGYILKQEGLNVFIGGTSDLPFINYCTLPNREEINYVIVEVSAIQMQDLRDFHPILVVFSKLGDKYDDKRFKSIGEYIETKLSIIKFLSPNDYLILNYDALSNNSYFRNANCQTYWYSRKSFVTMQVMNEIQGTHFHEKRIHSNIHYHSEFIVSKMRIVGEKNRENLLAAITACKALKVSDKSIQTCIEKFPGIPNRLEFIMEKNGVLFYNDSKCETMEELRESVAAFKTPIIIIAGGKDTEQVYENFGDIINQNVRVLILAGECKERMNRSLGGKVLTFLVGSFEESILLAYQKSRTGDTILLSPGNSSTDVFRDYEERGNYFKKLVYQL